MSNVPSQPQPQASNPAQIPSQPLQGFTPQPPILGYPAELNYQVPTATFGYPGYPGYPAYPYTASPVIPSSPVRVQPLAQSVVPYVQPVAYQQPIAVQQQPIKGESRIEYIPYERSVIEYEEVRQRVQIPKERYITDYYAVEYQTEIDMSNMSLLIDTKRELSTTQLKDKLYINSQQAIIDHQIVIKQQVVQQVPVQVPVQQIPVQQVPVQVPFQQIPVQQVPIQTVPFQSLPVQTLPPQNYSFQAPINFSPVKPGPSALPPNLGRTVAYPGQQPGQQQPLAATQKPQPANNQNQQPQNTKQPPQKSFLEKLFE